MNVQSLFSGGGLTINSTPQNSGLQQGPGYGYYGSNDVYKPPAPKGQVLGASTGGGSPAPAQNTGGGAPMQSQPQAPSVDFDALIKPALDSLDQLAGAQQTQYGADVASIDQGAQTARTNATTAQTDTNNQLDQRKQTTTTSAENAINESRRAASELQQGIAARYGSGSSLGLGASAILGAQSTRDIGHQRAQLSDALNQIETTKTAVQQHYTDALKEIETNTQTLKQQAQAKLSQSLAQIGQQKGQLQAQKAQMYAQAMDVYRQEVNQVNQQNTTFQQQLYVQAQQAAQQLAAAQQKASQQVSALPNYQFVKDDFGNIIAVNPKNPSQSQQVNPGGVTSQNLVGGNQALTNTGVSALGNDGVDPTILSQLGF